MTDDPSAPFATLGIAASGDLARVTMMQSAQARQFDGFALVRRLNRPRVRAVLGQRPVEAVTIIIAQIVGENAAQVILVQHNDVVQAFPADGANQSFDHWVLPGGARRSELLFQTQVLDSAHEVGAIDGIPIPEEITGGVVKGKASTICWAVQTAEGTSVMWK